MKSSLCHAALSLAALIFYFTAEAGAQVVERGRFRVYDAKQVQGVESYEIRRAGGGLAVRARLSLPFWGEERRPHLTATLRARADLTPVSFAVRGVDALEADVDTAVEIRGGSAEVREGRGRRRADAQGPFFTLASYAPVTLEMLLVRYWLGRGAGGAVRLLPGGDLATIERRGRDTLTLGGRRLTLERFHLESVSTGWGRQTLWLDRAGRLAAAVNLGGDVESNWTALGDGFDKAALSFFLRRAAEDAAARMTELAERLSPPRQGALALLGGTLIDGTGRPPVPDAAVIVEGGRIRAAGPRGAVTVPPGSTVVDARGRYVLPGLWDMHAHLYAAEMGPAYLAAGITTARDLGNEFEFATTLRDAERRGRGLGPRLLLAGYLDGPNDKRQFDVQARTPAEGRAAVRRYHAAGFEQIKIRDHVRPPVLSAVAREAHRLRMTLVGHVPEGMDPIDAVLAGQDHLSHINYVARAFETKEGPEGGKTEAEAPREIDFDYPGARRAFRVFKERGTVIDPTLATVELMLRGKDTPLESFEPGAARVAPALARQLRNKGLPPEAAAGGREAVRQLLALTGALHRAGVPLVAGSDVAVPGHSLHRELELFVRAGMTPLEAIRAATAVPARAMGLEAESGTIEPGKRADLLLTSADPLADIRNIRTVTSVVAAGRLYDAAALWLSVGFRP